MAQWSQLLFQDAASPTISQLIGFHDHAIILLTLVTAVVGQALLRIFINKLTCRTLLEAQQIETIWTILPAIVLQFLAIPSLRLLYLIDEIINPALTIKAIGHQWYWRYQYADFNKLRFDAYMTPLDSIQRGQFRLLEVDNRIVIPINVEVRIIITSSDVIHAWAIPCLGVKTDATPGRLNQIGILINRPGVFYGQCSEICGANHSFIPIALEAVNQESFINWITCNTQ